MKPTVVFDLDGTLADTSGDLLAAANACFRDLGLGDILVHPQDATTALHGGRAMLTKGFNRIGWTDMDEVDRQYQNLLDAYCQNISRYTRFYSGALDAVHTMQADGYSCPICTNKPEGLARQLLTYLDALDVFSVLIGADTLPVRKPNPDPFWAAVDQGGGDRARSVMVGDSATDQKTARHAGVPFILVDMGPMPLEDPDLECDAKTDSFAEIPTLVRQLIG